MGVAHFYPSTRGGGVTVEFVATHVLTYPIGKDGLGVLAAVTAEVIHDQTFVEPR